MMYESLLLNCGGGIINKADKSNQHTGTAALCIGIGGTGVAALSDLKGKIFQQLNPDNPDDPIPKYDAIQLLGIDSDDGDYKKYKGNRRLTDTEFFSIKKDNLSTLLTDPIGKKLIKDSRQLRWMEIDNITALLSPEGAGGVRQIGRYLLFERAASLVSKINEKCTTALKKRNSSSLDVYIFAGISGGTGSGCFLDVCYLVRHVVRTAGWNAKLMGYFFLPDVVTSKPEVASEPACVAYNNSNGYAAMKELDYLMSLQTANDWFEQSYDADIYVRTQDPPVDMCHLISAQQADGRMIPNGFGYGINVASDYAMAYLAEVESGNASEDDSGLTMRGHLANVARGVLGIPRRYGANLSYHILGASNAEIPMSQINTYLAIGFFQKFRQAAYRPKNIVTNDLVTRFMEENRFRVQDIFEDVVRDCPGLVLPAMDPKLLAQEPCCQKGHLPRAWAQTVNGWYAECRGQRQRNEMNLTRELVDYSYEKNNEQSLIGRLFRVLYKLSMNPQYGPYYAASMLINNGQDLYAALAGEVEKAESQARAQRIQIPDSEDWVIQCNQDLIDTRGRKKVYERFVGSVEDLASYCNATEQCVKTRDTLETFRSQVKDLYNNFFKPLCDLLDNLNETFEANAAYLMTPESKQPNAYTWQILSLDDVKDRLDAAVSELDSDVLVNRFVEALLEEPNAWRLGDQDQIALLIRDYLLKLFEEETSRGLKGYLSDRFPEAKNDPVTLVNAIKDHIIRRVDNGAVPMFWCDPTYNLTSKAFTFSTSSLSVPNICPEVCSAAEQYVESSDNKYTVRKTGIKDRIFSLRFVSGIPLFAYHGITKLKSHYDSAKGSAAGAGAHLYALTERGDDGSGHKDWCSYLPTPMPYSKNESMVPEGAELVKLYRKAESLGIIGLLLDSTGAAAGENSQLVQRYAIFVTPELSCKSYSLQDFLDRGVFSQSEYEKTVSALKKTSEELHKYGVNPQCTKVDLKNDGNKDVCDPEAVRIDYFIHYPKLHELVVKEIEKHDQLKQALAQVEAIGKEFGQYETDLTNFTGLVFFRFLKCLNNEGKPDYVKTANVKCTYKNQYGEDQEFYLSRSGMPYAKYPLYQAFRSYQYLRAVSEENPEQLDMVNHAMKDIRDLRKNLDEELAAYLKQIRTESDYIAAAILEQVWSTAALNELTNETLRGASDADRANISRFYNGLRNKIVHLKDESASWPRNRSITELAGMLGGNQAQSASQAAAPAMHWVHYNGKNLELYPSSSTSFAYDRSTNQWVPLNNQMFIAQNGQWVPIRLDPNNNVII